MNRDERMKLLEKEESHYNPEMGALRLPFHSPGYHTTLTKEKTPYVHMVRESLAYAHRLLDSMAGIYEPRAAFIIRRVLELQEKDPALDTFGIWPWFFEEPLAQMSPPDWNWADFLGKRLLLILAGHEERLSPDLVEEMRLAVCRACDAIMKRNVGPHYTNIAIMGATVTMLAGERFGRDDYVDYGLRRLETFAAYTDRTGNFAEFNSPTYTAVAIDEILVLDRYVHHPQAKAQCAKLLQLAWGTAAGHYHPPTGQWSGPHSRCYDSILGGYPYEFLQKLEGCPEELMPLMTGLVPRERRDTVMLSADPPFAVRAYTYMDERCSLGSFDREIMWNQRRNLIAYMNNGGKPTYVQLRFLKDGRDFSSAVFVSDQRKLEVLFAIVFATDGGDWTPVMDPVNGSFEANDLRLRLEIGGSLENVGLPVPEEQRQGQEQMQDRVEEGLWSIPMDGQKLLLRCGPGEFLNGSPAAQWEIIRSKERIGLDFIFYSGPRQSFDLHAMDRAYFTAGLTVCPEEHRPPLLIQEESKDGSQVHQLMMTCSGEGEALQLAFSPKPQPIQAHYVVRERSCQPAGGEENAENDQAALRRGL